MTTCRQNRLKYHELFDVSNVDADGSILGPENTRGQANRARKESQIGQLPWMTSVSNP